MGGGKTYTTLSVIDTLALSGECRRVLVLAPLRVARYVWPEQSGLWTPHLRCQFIGGAPQFNESHFSADIQTLNYEALPRLIARFSAGGWPYDMIVCDEAQRLRGFRGSFQKHPKTGRVYLRTGGTERASALAKAAWRSPRFLELSGTPAPKNLHPLWAQAWFIDGGRRLGATFSAFERRWFVPSWNGYGTELRDPNAGTEIMDRVSDIFMSISLDGDLDIKQPLVNDIVVPLPESARNQYQRMKSALRTQVAAGEITAANAAVRSIKLLQLANGAVYDDTGAWHESHSAKLDALDSIVEEAAGVPILCVYAWEHDLLRLKKRFPQGRSLLTDEDLRAFKAGECPLGFIHPASGGHGLNLADNCWTVVIFGLTWDTELLLQVLERVGPARQAQLGREQVVVIHRIQAEGTIDQAVIERTGANVSVQEALLRHVQA